MLDVFQIGFALVPAAITDPTADHYALLNVAVLLIGTVISAGAGILRARRISRQLPPMSKLSTGA